MKIIHVLLSIFLWAIPSCFSDVTVQGEKFQSLQQEQKKEEYIAKQIKKKIEDLCVASRLGNLDTVKRIVKDHVLNDIPKGGIRVDINGSERYIPLLDACIEARADIVAFLLTIPTINLNVKGKDGTTPLIAACECSQEEDIEIKKACIAIVQNILQLAKIKRIKLDLDAKVDGLGWTALMFASLCGNTTLVELLLKEGAETGYEDIEGLTALDIAATDEIKKLLLRAQQKK